MSTYAIIKTGGKQVKVEVGQAISLDLTTNPQSAHQLHLLPLEA